MRHNSSFLRFSSRLSLSFGGRRRLVLNARHSQSVLLAVRGLGSGSKRVQALSGLKLRLANGNNVTPEAVTKELVRAEVAQAPHGAVAAWCLWHVHDNVHSCHSARRGREHGGR